jgi:rubrerythrin
MTKEQFQEIVNFAVEREEEAERFYIDAAEKAKWPHIKELLLDMAKEEEGHARFLKALKMEKLEDTNIDPIPDLKLSDYMVDMEYRPDMDFQQIMVIAMKREESAVKLYEELGNTCTDPGVCKLFKMMAEEERKHKFNLEKEYEENVLQDN